jgi:hypothetical protein
MRFIVVMAREIFGPDYLPYKQEKQMNSSTIHIGLNYSLLFSFHFPYQ